MTGGDVRRLALALPEAHEEPHFDMPSFRIRGKIFATLPPMGDRVNVFIDPDQIEAAVGVGGGRVHELRWGKRHTGVWIEFDSADLDLVAELLYDAWRRRAPKRLSAAFEGLDKA
jgi:hypothetical protein